MSTASIEAQSRTRAFARVIGPYVATFTTVYAIRLPDLVEYMNDLFAQPVLIWLLGALMLGGGLVIIGGHAAGAAHSRSPCHCSAGSWPYAGSC